MKKLLIAVALFTFGSVTFAQEQSSKTSATATHVQPNPKTEKVEKTEAKNVRTEIKQDKRTTRHATEKKEHHDAKKELRKEESKK